MNLPNFDSESIEIDWLSFNVVGLHDPITLKLPIYQNTLNRMLQSMASLYSFVQI